MIERSRTASIEYKLNSSFFKKANEKNLDDPRRYIGSAKTAVFSMLKRSNIMKRLMPSLIGVSPSSTEWDKKVAHYWNSLSVSVTPNGKKLEVGYSYDVDADLPKLKALLESKKINTDEQLADWVEGKIKGKENVKEEDKILYGTPIKPEDYLLWMYTWNYRDVADTPQDQNKSPYIRFYIIFEGELEEIKRQSFQLEEEAAELYFKATRDSVLVDNLIYVFGASPISFKDDTDKRMFLKGKSIENSKEFINIVNDKNVLTKAKIERMIHLNLLKRLPNTTILVDSLDPTEQFAGSVEEAILIFKSDKEADINKIKTLELKLKNQTNK